KAPIPIPATHIEHALAAEVDVVELRLDEPPQPSMLRDVRGVRPRRHATGKVELVVPLDGVDSGLQIRHGHVLSSYHCGDRPPCLSPNAPAVAARFARLRCQRATAWSRKRAISRTIGSWVCYLAQFGGSAAGGGEDADGIRSLLAMDLPVDQLA